MSNAPTFVVIYALPDNPTVTFSIKVFAKDELEAFQKATMGTGRAIEHPDWITLIRPTVPEDRLRYRPRDTWKKTTY